MYGIRNREELDEPVAREFEALAAYLKAFLLTEHNEDGSHAFGEESELESSYSATIDSIIDRAQARGQWWKKGPWRLDDPNNVQRHQAFLLPPMLPGPATYDDFAPDGIDDCIGLEVEPAGGDIIITGIKIIPGSPTFKRILIFRNRDSSRSVTLAHADTGSLLENRFDLPDADDVVLGPGECAWLYYDPGREAWTLAVTPHSAGGLAAIGDDSVTFSKLQNIATDRLIGRDTAGSGDPEEITVGGGIEFTGTGGIQTSAFTGDVTKAAGGTATTIANDAVTYAKMQNVSATQRLLGRNSGGAGDTEEVTITQALDWLGE